MEFNIAYTNEDGARIIPLDQMPLDMQQKRFVLLTNEEGYSEKFELNTSRTLIENHTTRPNAPN